MNHEVLHKHLKFIEAKKGDVPNTKNSQKKRNISKILLFSQVVVNNIICNKISGGKLEAFSIAVTDF